MYKLYTIYLLSIIYFKKNLYIVISYTMVYQCELDSNWVEVHPYPCHNGYPVDGALMGPGSLWLWTSSNISYFNCLMIWSCHKGAKPLLWATYFLTVWWFDLAIRGKAIAMSNLFFNCLMIWSCHKGAKPLLWATYFYLTTRKAEGRRRESISKPPVFIYNLLATILLCILMCCLRHRRLLLRFRSTLWSFGDRHPVIWIMKDVIVSFASSSPVPWISTPSRNLFLGVEICLASL
jgi:hypothetical protein